MANTEQQPQERPSQSARLRQWFPELARCDWCGARRPRTIIDGVEYELDEHGEWVVVEN